LLKLVSSPTLLLAAMFSMREMGARWTGSPWTIVEADESDGTHLELPLAGSILTNVDSDHLDQYGDLQGIADGFQKYLQGINGPVVVCVDDPIIAGFEKTSHNRHLWIRESRRLSVSFG